MQIVICFVLFCFAVNTYLQPETFKCKHFTVLLCNDQINTEINLIIYYCNQAVCVCVRVPLFPLGLNSFFLNFILFFTFYVYRSIHLFVFSS